MLSAYHIIEDVKKICMFEPIIVYFLILMNSNSQSDFNAIFKSNYNAMCNISYIILKDKDSAKDVVQEVFIKLWAMAGKIDSITNVKGYLYRATTNASINYLTQKKKTQSLHKVSLTLIHNSEERTTIKELEDKIEKALNKLPPKCKAIFVLSRFEGMKYKEIADHLDISIKTVKNQMVIALDKMREDLKPYLTKEFLSFTFAIGLAYLVRFLGSCFLLLLQIADI